MFRVVLVRILAVAMLLAFNAPARAAWVTLTAPIAGAIYTAPATVTVSAEAGPVEGGERISSVKLYQDGVQVATGCCYTANLGAGTYRFHAVATSNLGTAYSSTNTITVVVPGGNPPTVTMNAPTGSPFIAPETIGLSANAADSDGQITQVEFYANGGLLGSATAAPFQLSWGNVAAGTYSLTARAYDNNGIGTTSSPVSLVVEPSKVIGNIDGLSLTGGTYYLSGWACSTGLNQAIDVHVYVEGSAGSGSWFGAYTANQASEPAVASACSAQGTAYRFSFPLTAAQRQQHANKKLYIHGISPVGNANDLIGGSGVFAVPAPLSLTRSYVYDAYQQLCKVIEPETGATVMAYDAAGNLEWSAAGLNLPSTASCDHGAAHGSGRRVDRGYGARNRLISLAFPDGNGNQAWSYTPDGLPAQIVTYNDGGGSSAINAYSYNKRRMMTGESLSQPGWYTWGIGYAYDANGSLLGQQYPTGLYIDYAPNALGQATRAGPYASGVTYHPNGGIARFTYGNGIVHTMTQNARQLPARVTDGNASDLTYAFDANANPVTIRDVNAVSGTYSGNRDLEYDGLDRLTHAHLHWAMVDNWTYDALDNIRSKSHYNGATTVNHSYWYDPSNRLTNLIDASTNATVAGLGYDVQGNLANKNGQTYSFDFGNRLRGVTGKESYRYDGHGRRILNWRPGTSTAPATLTLSQYAQNGQLAYQHNESKGQSFDHIYLGGSLIALRTYSHANWASQSVAYQHTDALGSPVAVTNDAGQVIERTHYEPYGAAINKTVDGVGYTGHVMDAATGLTYMQQRYYDPQIGRFLSVDPVTANGNTGGNFNRYWYANNNPYKFTDPDGRFGVLPEGARHAETSSVAPINPYSGPVLPTKSGVVTSGFGGRVHPVTGQVKAHNGTDFKAPKGEAIKSTQPGTVASVTSGGPGGNQVMVQNNDGSLSGYAHTGAAEGIREGTRVEAGATIGNSDGSGRITGPHLHYTYRPGTTESPATPATKPVDPVKTQLKDKEIKQK